jgi:gamma-glutamyltranspeptidase/glutathione hydrolase
MSLKPLSLLCAVLLSATTVLAQEVPAPVRPGAGSGGDIVSYDQIHHPVVGRGGMVVSQSAPASEVGVEILRRGGNAVDAAIAVALAQAVTLPRAGNLGGGGYMLVHMAATADQPAVDLAIDYYGVAPRALTPDFLLDDNGRFDRTTPAGFRNASVPGTVAGLWEAHQRFGSLPWSDLVAPAITLAEEGVRLSDGEAAATAGRAAVLALDPGAREAYLKPDGTPYGPGERFRQPQLAWSLRQVQAGGADAFYRGELARRIIAGVEAGGEEGDLEIFVAGEEEFQHAAAKKKGQKGILRPCSFTSRFLPAVRERGLELRNHRLKCVGVTREPGCLGKLRHVKLLAALEETAQHFPKIFGFVVGHTTTVTSPRVF